MASKGHGGLGKGLGALMGNTKLTPARDRVQEIPVEEIRPNRYQPRQDFDEAALETLKDSVKRIGIIEPLLVRRLPDQGYELIAGERRLRAAKLAGIQMVPAMIREYNDAEISEIALIENIQREDLNALEEAKAYDRLMKEFGLTQDIMAKTIGRSRSHIANFLRLLKLEPHVQDYVANGALSMGQAKPLLGLENQSLQREAAEYIQSEDLSARQAENLVRKLQADPEYLHQKSPEEKKTASDQDVHLTAAVEKLTHLLGTQVRIHPGKKKSRIEIEFYSPEDLERIMGTILTSQQDVTQQKIDALRKVSLTGKFTV